MKIKSGLLFSFLSLTILTHAPKSAADTNDVKIDLSGMTAIEEGQFRKAHFVGGAIKQMDYPIWNHRTYARLKMTAFIGGRLKISIAPEIKLWSNTYAENLEQDHTALPFRQWSKVTIEEGQGTFKFDDRENPRLALSIGIIPYKYNPDAHNLGEYLFRSGAYPPYIVTSFDRPYANLSGFRLNSTLLGNLHQDLFLITETSILPMFDWSLAYLAHYTIPSILDIGAGIDLHHWFPVVGMSTSQKTADNSYLDASGTKQYYTFKGIKLMGRVNFDVKGLLPDAVRNIMGPEDAKIFSEAAVLGLKDYKAYRRAADSTLYLDTTLGYYDSVKNRIPIMLGVNIPAFKIVDVISIQGELYKWKYLNSYFNQFYAGAVPAPTSTKGDITLADLKNGYIKWSVFVKKRITKGFDVMGQLARDHTFHEYYYESQRSDVEVFIKQGKNYEWGWWAKLQFSF
jgi:hypothetical protein